MHISPTISSFSHAGDSVYNTFLSKWLIVIDCRHFDARETALRLRKASTYRANNLISFITRVDTEQIFYLHHPAMRTDLALRNMFVCICNSAVYYHLCFYTAHRLVRLCCNLTFITEMWRFNDIHNGGLSPQPSGFLADRILTVALLVQCCVRRRLSSAT